MDMSIFHVESDKTMPIHPGSFLIASPLIPDLRFSHLVILIVEHDADGTIGLVMNQSMYPAHTLNMILEDTEEMPPIPIYRAGPLGANSLFYIHNIPFVNESTPLGSGVFLNGNLAVIQDYIISGYPVEGRIRFFTGYVSWRHGQLREEINENKWIVGRGSLKMFLRRHPKHQLWKSCMENMGGLHRLWATYPQIPSLN